MCVDDCLSSHKRVSGVMSICIEDITESGTIIMTSSTPANCAFRSPRASISSILISILVPNPITTSRSQNDCEPCSLGPERREADHAFLRNLQLYYSRKFSASSQGELTDSMFRSPHV